MKDVILIVSLLIISFLIAYILYKKRKKSTLYEGNIHIVPLEGQFPIEFEIKEYKNDVLSIEKVEDSDGSLLTETENILPNNVIPLIQEIISASFPVVSDMDKYKITFSEEVLAQLKDGTLSLMKNEKTDVMRGIAVNSTKKTVEHAQLVQNIDPALLMNVSFQLATVVVAQQHMQNINKNLNEIKGVLNQLIKNQLFEYKNHANVAVEYFEIAIIPFYEENRYIDRTYQIKAEDFFVESLKNIRVLFDKQDECIKLIKNLKNDYILGNIIKENEEVNNIICLNFYIYLYKKSYYLRKNK